MVRDLEVSEARTASVGSADRVTLLAGNQPEMTSN